MSSDGNNPQIPHPDVIKLVELATQAKNWKIGENVNMPYHIGDTQYKALQTIIKLITSRPDCLSDKELCAIGELFDGAYNVEGMHWEEELMGSDQYLVQKKFQYDTEKYVYLAMEELKKRRNADPQLLQSLSSKIEDRREKQREIEIAAEIAAEIARNEQKHRDILTRRRAKGLCIYCGKPLGFFLSVVKFKDQHKDCNEFTE